VAVVVRLNKFDQLEDLIRSAVFWWSSGSRRKLLTICRDEIRDCHSSSNVIWSWAYLKYCQFIW